MSEAPLEPGAIIGLLHPGAMGSAIGAELSSVGPHPVLWSGDGRSPETRRRAEHGGLTDVGSVSELVRRSDVVLSVCPPEAAEVVANEVLSVGFSGIYVDANAVSPDTARRIETRFEHFVDGGIVGPPPTAPGLTRLYLSGPRSSAVARLFAGTEVETRVVGDQPGAASAVKMCFASWTKGTSALLLAIRALAEVEGVTEPLLAEWETSMPDLVGRSNATAAAVGPKAWRFEGEMREIASTFSSGGLPPEFHLAAAEVYRRLAPLKGSTRPTIEEALKLLETGG